MNFSKLTKAHLIAQLEQRSLPTNGLKDDLIKRLKEAIEKESISEQDNQEENYDSEDENVDEVVSDDKLVSNEGSASPDKLSETLNDDEIVKEVNTTAILTVDDAINMKSTTDAENYSMIVNVNDDDNSMPNSINDRTGDFEQATGNRDVDNGEHEVIEIGEEVIIDDEDNQENDNNYNEEPLHNVQSEQDKDELESGESREEEVILPKEKITLWIHNIAEDVKALELKELFGNYGKVTSAKVVMNNKDSTGECFGCIELCNNEDAENCIKNLDKSEFRGKTITIARNICDITPKEPIQRNVSPVSSNDSWGGDEKKKEKSKSLSPFVCDPATEDQKEDTDSKEHGSDKYRGSYRGRGGYRGNNYGKNDNQDSRPRQEYRRGGDRGGNYGSRSDRYGEEPPRRDYRSNNDDSRSRDNYPRRGGGGRDDYGSKGGDSRYVPMNRDRYSSKDNFNDRPNRSRYDDDGRSSGPPRYNNYEHHHDSDRRGDRRPAYGDRARDGDYGSSSRRDADAPPFKRPRMEGQDDYYGSKSRRRDDYSPPDRAGPGGAPSRDRYRAPSPKRSFYYSDKEPSYHHHRSGDAPRTEERGQYDRGSSRPDYSGPSGPRKGPSDYGRSSATYSPPTRPPRSHNYVKESYTADFGGRSRNYDR